MNLLHCANVFTHCVFLLVIVYDEAILYRFCCCSSSVVEQEMSHYYNNFIVRISVDRWQSYWLRECCKLFADCDKHMCVRVICGQAVLKLIEVVIINNTFWRFTMSSQRGNVSRTRKQKHTNSISFKNNKHGETPQTKVLNSLQVLY